MKFDAKTGKYVDAPNHAFGVAPKPSKTALAVKLGLSLNDRLKEILGKGKK